MSSKSLLSAPSPSTCWSLPANLPSPSAFPSASSFWPCLLGDPGESPSPLKELRVADESREDSRFSGLEVTGKDKGLAPTCSGFPRRLGGCTCFAFDCSFPALCISIKARTFRPPVWSLAPGFIGICSGASDSASPSKRGGASCIDRRTFPHGATLASLSCQSPSWQGVLRACGTILSPPNMPLRQLHQAAHLTKQFCHADR
mmetsp:Transcript_88831/g.170236  ORF Transcript_88831/g.170236 Transcript_88831/m.170236 type:complete len:202 (-) Transcript_88831:128-733(-)